MLEMNYCGPHGIPWDQFMAWPKISRDAALLWQSHRDEKCGSCGTHPDDWDPDLGGHPRAWVATVHHCPGCAAVDSRMKREKNELPPGDSIFLRRQVRYDPGGWP